MRQIRKASIEEHLLARHKKAQLLALGQRLGVDLEMRLKKEEMVMEIAHFVRDELERVLRRVNREELMLLDTVVRGGGNWPLTEEEQFESLLNIGIVGVRRVGVNLAFQVAKEVRDELQGILPSLLEDETLIKQQAQADLLLGAVNLFGMISLESLSTALKRADGNWASPPAIECLAHHRLRLMRELRVVDVNNERMLMSRKVERVYELWSVLQDERDMPYKGFTKQEFRAAANPLYVPVSDGVSRMRDLLKELGFFSTEKLLHQLWMMICNEYEDEQLMAVLLEAAEYPSESLVAQLRLLLDQMLDELPSWANKGYSLDEILEMPLDYASHPFIPLNPPAPRHLKMDDACPCGSGLAYGKCHGAN